MKLCCILAVLLLASSVEPAVSSRWPYDSIFCLGASLADTGNGNFVSAASKVPNPSAHPPYGETFFRHPTGRRCNGRLIIDFVAEEFGLPFLPPSLSHNANFSHGANFAVLGSTALDVSFFSFGDGPVQIPNTSSGVQLRWFEALKPKLCSPAQVCPPGFFAKSLFFMGEFGLNDYNNALMELTPAQARSIVPDVVSAIANATEGLIKQGATNVVVPGVPPLGCFPPVLQQFASDDLTDYEPGTGCIKEMNELATYHNTLVQETVQNVRRNHPDVMVVYADFFTPVIEMVESPRKFGFTDDVLSCCCGGGGRYNFNASAGCGMPGATVCENPDAYLFWDDHFTEAANRNIAKAWLNKLRIQTHLMGATGRYISIAK